MCECVCRGVCGGVDEGQNSSSLVLADIPVLIQFIMNYLKVQYMIYGIMLTLIEFFLRLVSFYHCCCFSSSI